jgi:YVTN family beta-propeller protein
VACARGPRRVVARLPPLVDSGEIHLFVQPLGGEAERLSFSVESVSLLRQDGAPIPLQLEARELTGSDGRGQRLLAWGRVPPGEYVGFAVEASSAMLGRGDERSRLLVLEEPERVPIELGVESGRAVVVWATLETTRALRGDFGFSPVLSAILAPQTPPQVALYCTNTAAATVTAVDRGTRLVTGVVAVGAAPRGIVLDPVERRAHVALSGEDQLEILDLAADRSIGRIRLTPGDEPTELAAADGRTLVVVNARSRTASFVDPVAMTELGRVPVGDAPSSLLVDRQGRRAYVTNRASATITVLDVANRAVFATLSTDPEPIDTALSRDGSRLYVVHRGSAYLGVFALPSLAPVTRAYVGLGVTAIKVDPRSDLIYLSRGDERRIAVYDPVALQPIESFEVPGAVSQMTIDDTENALLALMPARRAIAVLDLTSRRLLAEIPVGADAYQVTLIGERF